MPASHLPPTRICFVIRSFVIPSWSPISSTTSDMAYGKSTSVPPNCHLWKIVSQSRRPSGLVLIFYTVTGQVTIKSRRIAARGTYNDIYKGKRPLTLCHLSTIDFLRTGEWLDKESVSTDSLSKIF